MSVRCTDYGICEIGSEYRDGVLYTEYDDACLQEFEENCVGQLNQDVCRVSCVRRGRRGSFENSECRQLCEDNFKAFEFQDTSKQYGLEPEPVPTLCSQAFEDCVVGGVIDEDCLKDYELCHGNLAEHCDLACIRTPGLQCQTQCRDHYYKTFDSPLAPLSTYNRANRRNIFARNIFARKF